MLIFIYSLVVSAIVMFFYVHLQTIFFIQLSLKSLYSF